VTVFDTLEDFLPLPARGLKRGIFLLSIKGLDRDKSHELRADRGAMMSDEFLNELVIPRTKNERYWFTEKNVKFQFVIVQYQVPPI
jgi:hypothetical protein